MTTQYSFFSIAQGSIEAVSLQSAIGYSICNPVTAYPSKDASQPIQPRCPRKAWKEIQ